MLKEVFAGTLLSCFCECSDGDVPTCVGVDRGGCGYRSQR